VDDVAQAHTNRRGATLTHPVPGGPPSPRRRSRPPARYVPLAYRVAGYNAIVLVATVVVTILVLAPHKLSSFETNEAITLGLALILIVALNLVMLRRAVAPLQKLTALARRVDLSSRPGERMPGAAPTSEAGELALTFNEMLARLEAERSEATGRVLAGQEAERLRIAQELHDQIGQELTAVLLGLARLRNAVDADTAEDVGAVQEAVRASLEDVRRIALELRPEALDDLGLHSALAVLCERFAQRSGLTVEQRISEPLPPLDSESELVVYRVAQEALTNVARHAGTGHAVLALRARAPGGPLVLTISDEGHGIAGDTEPGTGMRGMRERATLIGAQLTIGAGPAGRGCVVELALADGCALVAAAERT
jgi:two-component system, NarL family, sensor histidine kinase UhpB